MPPCAIYRRNRAEKAAGLENVIEPCAATLSHPRHRNRKLFPVSHCSVSALVADAHEDRDELLTAESRFGNREAHQLEAFFSGLV